jgi:hypothetical protein
MVKREVLNQLLDSKKIAIIQTLLNSNEELNLQEISKESKVPMASAFRILQNLTTAELISRNVWKNNKTYTMLANEKTNFLKELLNFETSPLDGFIDSIRQMSTVSKVLLNDLSKTSANILIIGEHVNKNRLEEISQIKNFSISYVIVTEEQFSQMIKMGIYKEKKTLFSR